MAAKAKKPTFEEVMSEGLRLILSSPSARTVLLDFCRDWAYTIHAETAYERGVAEGHREKTNALIQQVDRFCGPEEAAALISDLLRQGVEPWQKPQLKAVTQEPETQAQTAEAI